MSETNAIDRAAKRAKSRATKRRALRRGARGERLAAIALALKGYRIVGRNYRCPMGEIDIIARKSDLIIFVEVKARDSWVAAVDAVALEAQRRLANAAEHWLARQRDAARLSWRFDIVAIKPWRWPMHIAEAF